MNRKKIAIITLGIAMLCSMTSCLKSKGRDISENQMITYFVRDELSGMIYGRTGSGLPIYSNKFDQDKCFRTVTYEWNEDNDGYVNFGNYQLPKVNVVEISDPIDKVQLEEGNLVDSVKTIDFNFLNLLVYARDPNYFADHWIFRYGYKAPEGERVVTSFYVRPSALDSPQINIDVYIMVLNKAKDDGAKKKDKVDYVALDMSTLRAKYKQEGASNQSLDIKFYYYIEGHEQIPSPNYQLLLNWENR